MSTDRIRICARPLGPKFPKGIFVCHTDRSPRPLLGTDWAEIAAGLAR